MTKTPRDRRRSLLLLATAAATLLFGVSAVALLALRGKGSGGGAKSTLPSLFSAGEFRFVDQTGAPFGSAELAGKIWVGNFVFTRCPTVCPAFTAKMARVGKAVSHPEIRLVSFSVDPEFDTPEVLAAYGKKHGADPARWRFLTGDYEAMRTFVTSGLKVQMERGADKSDLFAVAHGSHFVLVDGAGVVRGFYDSNDEAKLAALARDAEALAAGSD